MDNYGSKNKNINQIYAFYMIIKKEEDKLDIKYIYYI